ncbi:putative Ig domain-containing protein [Streptomyces sp. NBC_01485]|uniref:putative Ig domain-containing protein n=1 Tax=Streptomyces sp. NBC_01485 TaxID=2903884 RepID=UPI002E37ABE0|nr:putative Ig domain-containing protein [Streptomyces sp. NBC_01485]
MGVSVVFEDGGDAVEVVPGEEAVCVLRVENTGMVVDRVLLDVLGEAAEWARVEPAQANLLPGEVQQVRVLFHPPRTASQAPGEVRFGLRAMSTEDSEGSCVEEGSVRVGEFGDIGAQLVPRSATGRRSARFKLVVENRGNRPERVRVEALDPEVKLGFKTKPATFVARPGTATFVRLKTVPRKTFWRGPNRTLPFEVSALPERGEAAKTEGVMLEKQTLPEWLLPVLGITVLACGLLFALWMTVLQPVAHSAASAAADAQDAASSAKSAAAKAMATAKPSPPAKPTPPTGLAVKLSSSTVAMGASERATSSFSGGTGSHPELVWTSSAPRVATVSQSGVVTALNPGTAIITATSAGGPASTASGAPASGAPSPGAPATAAPSADAPSTAASSSAAGAKPGPAAGTSSPSPAGGAVLSGSVTVNVVGPVSVTTASLSEAARGKAYSESLGATGGTGAYTWSVTSGSLPAGLSLSPRTGAITGTPVTAGTSGFTVRLAEPGPPALFTTKAFKLTVRNSLAVNSSSLPGATTGTAYSQTLEAVGGTAPYKWSLAPGQGALPNGLRLDPASGAITGTPAVAGTYGVTVKVADSAVPSQSATQHLSMTVATPLGINTLALPDGVTKTLYSQPLSASGGVEPYTWSVSAPPRSLPSGLTLDPKSGVLGGTPGAAGSSTFTVRVTDSAMPAHTTSQTFTVEVVTGFAATTSSLPQGTMCDSSCAKDYATQLTAAGGTAPYVWTLTGTLPDGLSLTPNGSITGKPKATGSFPFSVQATDSSKPPLTTTKTLTMTVVASLRIITVSPLPHALTGKPYSQTLKAVGGAAPYTWSLAPDSPLPDGLSLDRVTGVISGTPESTGTATLSVSVSDSGPTPQTADLSALTLTVVLPLGFQEPPAIPEAALGFPYKGFAPTNVIGGSGTQRWSVTDGALPNGLRLDPRTGAVTGTVQPPASAGTYQFTVTVSDATDYTVTAKTSISITVVNPLAVQSRYEWAGTVGTPFQGGTVQPTAGLAPYRFTLAAGPGSGWMSIGSSTGEVTGTPDGPCQNPASTDGPDSGSVTITCAASGFTGQVTVTDALGESVTTTLNVTAAVPPLSVKFNTSTPTQTGGSPLTAFSVTAEGPSGGYGAGTYSYAASPLPCDESGSHCDRIDPVTGAVSGEIDDLVAGTTTFTVTVTSTDPHDSHNTVTARFQESIKTRPAPTPAPSPAPSSAGSIGGGSI